MRRRTVPLDEDALYRELIAQCDDEPAQDVIAGQVWSLVQTEHATGLSMSLWSHSTGDHSPFFHLRGKPLVGLAELALSWNPREAAIGMAAICAACNITSRFAGAEETNGRDLLLTKAAGKRVGLIGHFPWTDEIRSACGSLTVFEQQPQEGDLPQQAEEYVLPHLDVVAITGSALTNKSLPRLLELACNAWVMLIGPSTPLSVLMFDYGVNALSGCVARDPEELAEVVREGGGVREFRNAVRFVTLQKP
ncbi:MAG: Rossmann-like domain-containing protein [Candidatus Cryosericum sp.]